MKSFIFEKIPKVYFGEGSLKQALSTELKKIGSNVMVAYGGGSIKKNGVYDEIVKILKENDKNIIEFNGIMSNPTYNKVQEGANIAKENNVDFILAVGGGSVVDCCKIVSVQAKTEEDIWKLEFEKREFPKSGIPMAAIVTASGTGAEMNSGAVITNEELNMKTGMLGSLAEFVVLDSTYTLTVPMKQVISGAFDTLSHCMETYFGISEETNVSDEINEAIMRNVIKNITDKEILRKVADTSNISKGCCMQLTSNEIYEILLECL